jgi:hypothetical protein
VNPIVWRPWLEDAKVKSKPKTLKVKPPFIPSEQTFGTARYVPLGADYILGANHLYTCRWAARCHYREAEMLRKKTIKWKGKFPKL